VRKLFRWSDKRYDQEYWGRLERNWRQWKGKRSGERKIETIENVTNFIQSYLHQFFDDSHSLRSNKKPSKRPFNRCQSRLEVINIGQDIKQIN